MEVPTWAAVAVAIITALGGVSGVTGAVVAIKSSAVSARKDELDVLRQTIEELGQENERLRRRVAELERENARLLAALGMSAVVHEQTEPRRKGLAIRDDI